MITSVYVTGLPDDVTEAELAQARSMWLSVCRAPYVRDIEGLWASCTQRSCEECHSLLLACRVSHADQGCRMT